VLAKCLKSDFQQNAWRSAHEGGRYMRMDLGKNRE
jgi:hypothetical protein